MVEVEAMMHKGRRHRRTRRGGALAAAALAVAALCVAVYVVAGQGGGHWTAARDEPAGAAATTAALPGPPAARPSATTPSASPTAKRRPPTAPASASPSPRPKAERTKAAPPPAGTGAGPAPRPGSRVFTFVNHVSRTIWLASGEQTAQPALTTTGWVLKAGQTLSVQVPDKWNGRFWGRTGCSFDASGSGHCETGDCAGRFQCHQYGVIPATLAEFNLNSWNGLDFYDVSLVDGSNLPMYINLVGGTTEDPISAGGCSAAGCTHDVACPAELRIEAGGRTVGCESPCGVFDTDQYCCRAQWAPRDKCLPAQWPVDYAALFKKAEPFAYSYVDDDATSTFTSQGEAGYRITFGLS
ncbi:thaumatin family protein [Actinacidiphila sp. ITFR-21]|uniref:thaumatin family protein n=1 Tax=Actinacidiphila sp. ITFR-21 TaxID=3075199 RepID=UPI00288AF81B|nr:thaumatin family protein [Streptomyces sp. ITFR-21]WNI18617.1 thaumatin family protein [Streptomyces sp. ITFR-21]